LKVVNTKVGKALLKSVTKHSVSFARPSHSIRETSHVKTLFDLRDGRVQQRLVDFSVRALFVENVIKREILVSD
jgi:hypothetical protein